MGQYIATVGPKGSGKTTLGTRIISSSRSREYCAIRVYLNPKNKGEPEEIESSEKPELRLYDEAGTIDVVGLRCNKNNCYEAIDSQLAHYYLWEGKRLSVIIEGNDIFASFPYDVIVFVIGVLGPGEEIEKPLKEGQSKSRGQIFTLKQPPVKEVILSLIRKFEEGEEPPTDEERLQERIKKEALKHLALTTESSLLPKFQGLEHARIIIINKRKNDPIELLERTKKKLEDYLDSVDWNLRGRKRLVYAVDLSDKKDIGLRNVLMSIKRSR